MKKYLFGLLAIAVAVGFSAFTKAPSIKGKKFTTGDYYYIFGGSQTVSDREAAANYSSPQLSAPSSCPNITNECAVKVTVTLDIHGNPPAHPDFTNVTFDGSTGYPNGGTAFKANLLLQ